MHYVNSHMILRSLVTLHQLQRLVSPVTRIIETRKKKESSTCHWSKSVLWKCLRVSNMQPSMWCGVEVRVRMKSWGHKTVREKSDLFIHVGFRRLTWRDNTRLNEAAHRHIVNQNITTFIMSNNSLTVNCEGGFSLLLIQVGSSSLPYSNLPRYWVSRPDCCTYQCV